MHIVDIVRCSMFIIMFIYGVRRRRVWNGSFFSRYQSPAVSNASAGCPEVKVEVVLGRERVE